MSNEQLTSETGLYDRFVNMWHDLMDAPNKHTQRYANVSEMFKEADSELSRLHQDLARCENAHKVLLADAKRYQWLKLHADTVFLDQEVSVQTNVGPIYILSVGRRELDEAIDYGIRSTEQAPEVRT